jgi:hypothetical protein
MAASFIGGVGVQELRIALTTTAPSAYATRSARTRTAPAS